MAPLVGMVDGAMRTVNDTARLTAAETNSPLWSELSQFLAKRLSVLRAENDNDIDPIKTARLRGKIAFAKELLALASEPAPEPEADDGE